MFGYKDLDSFNYNCEFFLEQFTDYYKVNQNINFYSKRQYDINKEMNLNLDIQSDYYINEIMKFQNKNNKVNKKGKGKIQIITNKNKNHLDEIAAGLDHSIPISTSLKENLDKTNKKITLIFKTT